MNTNKNTDIKAQEFEFDTKSASERLEELDKLSPRDIELQIERTRTEDIDATPGKKSIAHKNNPKPRRQNIDKNQLDDSFNKILARAQGELSINDRLFSRIIHNKPIEIISDIIANTLARPNAILFGAISAFIINLIIYITAKTIGYSLSGSETIIAFAIGWVVGLIYDLFKIIITNEN